MQQGMQGDAVPMPEREERCLGDHVQEPSLPSLVPRLPQQAVKVRYLKSYEGFYL